MAETLQKRARFGSFSLDLKAGELRSGDSAVLLQEQSFQILRMLVENDGALVSREEIRKRLWPNDTVVEFEHSINAAIAKLRKVLGDTKDDPKYIQTVSRRGYRLVVPVEWEASDSDAKSPDAVSSDDAAAPHQAKTAGLIGRKVSHYRVLEVIGGGGMGMVYKAEDLKLGRQVALKFLPEELAWDPVALRRFEREARTASSLDHPNICTIYGVEEHDEQPFLVMQLLEGETLRDRLAAASSGTKPLGLDELLDITCQTCGGLEAAHAKSIIHRDIKPANIFLTSTGQAKILDFGVAKLVSEAQEAGSDELRVIPGDGHAGECVRSRKLDTTLTHLGDALGTAGYMSPEQIRGERLDARTDIFSFGLVLYEMATGQRPFNGATAAVVRDAILNETPALARTLSPKLPVKLVSIIGKTLEKDRDRRYQSVREVRVALEELRRPIAPSASMRLQRTLVVSLAIVVLVALGVGVWRWRRPLAQRAFQNYRMTRLTTAGNVAVADISRDGRYLAYADDEVAQHSLWVHDLSASKTERLLGPSAEYIRSLRFAPDVDSFYYAQADPAVSEQSLYSLPAIGGLPRKVVTDVGWRSSVGFSSDGTQIAFTRRSDSKGEYYLFVAKADGSAERRLLTLSGKEMIGFPAWSPDGKMIAFGIDEEGGGGLNCVAVLAVKGGKERRILRYADVTGIYWLPDQSGLVLAGMPFGDANSSLEILSYPDGKLRRITSDLSDYIGVGLAHGGSSLVTVQKQLDSSLWVAPADNPTNATPLREGTGPTDGIRGVAWLPNERLVYGTGDGPHSEVWVVDRDGSHPTQLTHTNDASSFPFATAAYSTIVFTRKDPTSHVFNIWAVDMDGSNLRQVTSGTPSKWAAEISSDGKWVCYLSMEGTWKVALSGGPVTRLGNSSFSNATFSPDGRWVAFSAADIRNKKDVIEIVSSAGDSPSRFLPFIDESEIPESTGIQWPAIRWTADGKAITYVRTKHGVSNLWAQPIDGGAAKQLTNFTSMIIWSHDWSLDGKSLVIARGNFSRDAVMLTDLR